MRWALNVVSLWNCLLFQSPSLSQAFHQLPHLMSRMSELLVRQDLGSPGTRQLLESCLIFHHSNIPTSTSKHSHYEPVIAIPMPCQCHWQSVCGPPVRLWSHGLTAAICLPLLKPAVFTYSLFPLLWILPLVFTARWSGCIFLTTITKPLLLPILF